MNSTKRTIFVKENQGNSPSVRNWHIDHKDNLGNMFIKEEYQMSTPMRSLNRDSLGKGSYHHRQGSG